MASDIHAQSRYICLDAVRTVTTMLTNSSGLHCGTPTEAALLHAGLLASLTGEDLVGSSCKATCKHVCAPAGSLKQQPVWARDSFVAWSG